MTTPKKDAPQQYRLKVSMPRLALDAGHQVYRHPKAVVPPGRFPAALEPRPDACYFPVAEGDVELVV